ncbi:hypothetical protein BDQ94DRAFT_142154 [Aspergillus welwitschiae]|uniref:Uncharacterized protein n=1 Tax=Aspergillus welwitschiae TaxID=1341132 RepID=A0A3F3Q600_9EURO|nr:hypothetical protein BDQ94DRAFT_142154 [Aspergillus welwitschiae]RDH34146.1 hypothetical protein BDQ94DRAFT_142154 [Aspergillus welwitschiae]
MEARNHDHGSWFNHFPSSTTPVAPTTGDGNGEGIGVCSAIFPSAVTERNTLSQFLNVGGPKRNSVGNYHCQSQTR